MSEGWRSWDYGSTLMVLRGLQSHTWQVFGDHVVLATFKVNVFTLVLQIRGPLYMNQALQFCFVCLLMFI